MKATRILLFLFSVLFAGLQAGCSDGPQFRGECQADSECGVGFECRAGLCFCKPEAEDVACGEGAFCNNQGLCQTKQGCRRNSDCDDNTKFCDIASGECVDRTGCASDVHCSPGTVCQASACTMGCRETADCPLGAVCEKAVGTPAEGLGMCFLGRCDDKGFCPFGQDCINGGCVPNANPNHCAACSNQIGDCGGGNNSCLINVNHDPNDPNSEGPYFCGVECQMGDQASCPSGYRCGPVQLLTQDLCTIGSNECGQDRFCVGGEGDTRGACTCANDADCAIDEIPARCAGSCGGLGLAPCETNADCSFLSCERTCQGDGSACTQDSECQAVPFCRQGTCVTDGFTSCSTSEDCLCNLGTCIGTGRSCSQGSDCSLTCSGGACLLGFTCAPDEGLTCRDLGR